MTKDSEGGIASSQSETAMNAPNSTFEIMRWRKSERERLIAMRLACPADQRAAAGERIARRLDDELGNIRGRSIGIYWPFRGEPDLRGWAARTIRRGGHFALPVVVAKGQPLIFRAWAPGDRLEKGVWNIPIPAEGKETQPDIVVSPLVGFDGGMYRLGYGGGFYDRTLASMPRKPLTIGVGYGFARLATIFPQWHDVPMDRLVVEETEATA